jgi:circadian clock protein KaiC
LRTNERAELKERTCETDGNVVRPDGVSDEERRLGLFEPQPTGVPGLDDILGGGLPRGALTFLAGPPGSGKTILSTQMVFSEARRGKRGLLLTSYAEPAIKLIEQLRCYSFFSGELVGQAVQFLSLQQFLSEGLEATADAVLQTARDLRAALVVLDGFGGIRGAGENGQEVRRFLHGVATSLSLLGSTLIVTSELPPRDVTFFPEATTADVILGLHFEVTGLRQQRWIEAIKVRNRAPLAGLHSFLLSSDGAAVCPRLEAAYLSSSRQASRDAGATAAPPDETATVRRQSPRLKERASFDLAELDDLLHGGINRETSTLLTGSLGTGKTLLGLHFALAGLRNGEAVVFAGFRETAEQILHKADDFELGEDLRARLAPGGGFTLSRRDPVELNPDVLAAHILDEIDRTGARRLVVDSVAELERAVEDSVDSRRVPNYMAALLAALRIRGITAIFIKETDEVVSSELTLASDALSVLAENVIWLQQIKYADRLRRVISVVKMRFSAHDASVRELVIGPPEGIKVRLLSETEEGLLQGIARQEGGHATAPGAA